MCVLSSPCFNPPSSPSSSCLPWKTRGPHPSTCPRRQPGAHSDLNNLQACDRKGLGLWWGGQGHGECWEKFLGILRRWRQDSNNCKQPSAQGLAYSRCLVSGGRRTSSPCLLSLAACRISHLLLIGTVSEDSSGLITPSPIPYEASPSAGPVGTQLTTQNHPGSQS